MNRLLAVAGAVALMLTFPRRGLTEEAGQPLFDGSTLTGWSGAPGVWRVQDGCIFGESNEGHVSGDTFLVWTAGIAGDFDLSAQVRLEGNSGSNGGIQYRSRFAPFPQLAVLHAAHPPLGPGGGPVRQLFQPAYEKWNLAGYQDDISADGMGQLFEGGAPPARGIVTKAGEVTLLSPSGPPIVLGHIAGSAASDDLARWHTLRIIARGHTLLHFVDGSLRSATIDDNPARRADRGLIGVQLETTARARIWVRDIRLRVFDTKAN